jgi:hypothetical protein
MLGAFCPLHPDDMKNLRAVPPNKRKAIPLETRVQGDQEDFPVSLRFAFRVSASKVQPPAASHPISPPVRANRHGGGVQSQQCKLIFLRRSRDTGLHELGIGEHGVGPLPWRSGCCPCLTKVVHHAFQFTPRLRVQASEASVRIVVQGGCHSGSQLEFTSRSRVQGFSSRRGPGCRLSVSRRFDVRCNLTLARQYQVATVLAPFPCSSC